MVQFTRTFVAGLIGLAGLGFAHPGHDVKAEAAERAAFLKRTPIESRSLGHCAENLKARGYEAKNVARRQQTVEQLRRKRGIQARSSHLNARDLDALLNTTHHSTLDVSPVTDPLVLFQSNASCILGPDVTQGPYYVTGELIRKNVVEDQAGVPMFLDIQLIDTNTCEPVPRVYIDLWHCNATGVYSGVVANGNGDSNDTTNINSTFLRGIQQTDPYGVSQFETIFPGHYTGRTTHIHILSHAANETIRLRNNTVSGLYTSHASHVGQIFFDQELIHKVEAMPPYSTNTQELTTNTDDSILAQEADTIDPFVQYVFLNEENVQDGIFAWISMGIDATEDAAVTPAAYMTGDGGIENENSGMGGPGGAPPGGAGAPPNGTLPGM